MKIVICDDEIPTLNLLEKILDWEELGITGIFKAYNGKEALSIIRKEKPEILITDIIMPEMDGLELIGRIREEAIKIRIIILSAFNEFGYAQKAIGYGVKGYLLKPLDEEKLETMVQESIQDIETDLSKKEVYRKSLDYATERLLRQLLYPRNNLEEYKKIMNMLEIKLNLDSFRMALLSVTRLDYNNYITSTEREGPDELITRTAEKLKKSYSEKIYLFENTPDEYVIILNGASEHLQEKVISDCLGLLLKEKNISAVIALSSPCNSYFNIHQAYEETSSYAARKHLFENERVLRPEMFTNIKESPDNRDEHPHQGADRSRYIRKAKQYISEHYSENINLDEICSFAGVSKNYFCHLFRNETGLSIWEFLTDFRVEKARQLLAGSDMKNYEIAYHIGYENPSYFSRIFRKLTGKSPTDYRNEINKI